MNRNDQVVEQELLRIHDQFGILRPADVVREAADAASALHPFFEWHDATAAHQHRLEQARELIRVQLRFEPRTQKYHNLFVSLASDRTVVDGGYRPTTTVLLRANTRAEMLGDALRELDRLRVKYAELLELADVFAAAQAAAAQAAATPPPPPATGQPPAQLPSA